MGKRGPKPKPQELRDLDGNPEKRPRQKPAIKADGNVRKPRYLTAYASEVWSEVVASMPPKFFTQADNHALAAYCMATDMMRQAIEDIEQNGIIVLNGALNDGEGNVLKSGTKARNPATAVLSDAQSKITSLGTRLGFDPAARQALGTGVADPDDPDKTGYGDLIARPGGKKV